MLTQFWRKKSPNMMGMKISIAILENNEVVVLKTKDKSNTVFPAILVLGIYPKDMKSADK